MHELQVLVVGAVLAISAYLLLRKRKIDLPGPPQTFFFGNATQIDPKGVHLNLSKWAKEYGEVFKINFMGDDIVVVNSEQGIREVFLTKANDFAGRPDDFHIKYFLEDTDIVFESYSEKWHHLKRLSMTGLRMVGQGVERLEELTVDIIDEVVKDMVSKKGQPYDYRAIIHHAVANITALLIFGVRLTDKELKEDLHLEQEVNEAASPSTTKAILNKWPVLFLIPTNLHNHMRRLNKSYSSWFRKQIARKIASFEKHENQSALDDIIKEHLNSKAGKHNISMGNILSVSKNLIGAGTLTTSSVLYALIAQVAANQDIQTKAQRTINDAIGDRQVILKDRASMPYIDSMLLEILRLLSHVPLSVPHKTMKETKILGTELPKGITVWANLWHLHHDENLWEDPWCFKPDRFLDEKGNIVPTDHPLRKKLLPFGAGRRVCVGEAMARNRLFLFTVSLLQKFSFKPESDSSKLPCDPRDFQLGIVLRPDDYKVRAIPRYE